MLIITGTIAYDHIMDFPGKFADHILPEQLYNINLSFIVYTFARRRGGTAGNVSYSLGLLNTDHILFSVAGKDFGEYKKVFKKHGINTSNVLIDKTNYTATGFAMTDSTNNQIWGYFYGAASNIDKLQLQKVISPSPSRGEGRGEGDLVLVGPSGAAGSLSFVRQCVDLSIPYMFDPGFILTQVNNVDLAFGVNHAHILIGNDYEINLISSRIKNFADIAYKKIVITTLGDKGAIIDDHGKKMMIKPAVTQKVVDPTGAGDSWRSGFLAGYTRGFDLQTCGQMGAIASVYTVEQYGTQEHTYTKKQFMRRYRQTFSSMVEL